MHERRGLEGVAGCFLGHLIRGQVAQLLINQRQKFCRRSGLAALDPVEKLARRNSMNEIQAACAALEQEVAHLQQALATFAGAA